MLTGRPNLKGVYGAAANPIRLVHLMRLVAVCSREVGGRPLEILEVGSWCGASALTMGEALARHHPPGGCITCVDAWEPYRTDGAPADSLEREMEEALADGSAFRVFRENMAYLPAGVGSRVIRGRSAEVMPALEPGSYDIVYIDGDHAYPAVSADLEAAIPLVAPGGFLAGDDLELQASEADVTAFSAETDKAVDPASGEVFHPGVARAVSERIGRVSVWDGFWAVAKEPDGWRRISLDGTRSIIPETVTGRALIGLKALMMARGWRV